MRERWRALMPLMLLLSYVARCCYAPRQLRDASTDALAASERADERSRLAVMSSYAAALDITRCALMTRVEEMACATRFTAPMRHADGALLRAAPHASADATLPCCLYYAYAMIRHAISCYIFPDYLRHDTLIPCLIRHAATLTLFRHYCRCRCCFSC